MQYLFTFFLRIEKRLVQENKTIKTKSLRLCLTNNSNFAAAVDADK